MRGRRGKARDLRLGLGLLRVSVVHDGGTRVGGVDPVDVVPCAHGLRLGVGVLRLHRRQRRVRRDTLSDVGAEGLECEHEGTVRRSREWITAVRKNTHKRVYVWHRKVDGFMW